MKKFKGNWKVFEFHKNAHTTYQNLWDAANAVFIRNFIASNAYIRKEEISQVSYLHFHIKKLDKVEQIKSKVSRKNEIFKKEEQKSMKHKTK